MKFSRVFLVVLDSVGIGAAPDAHKYGDIGAHTLANMAEYVDGLNIPNLQSLGLGNLAEIKGVPSTKNPQAHYTKMAEASVGKDTMTGHWELMGLHIEQAFNTFPTGFPPDLIKEIETRTGRSVIGNKPASGTAIIDELGREHIETGALIVYTSADSVLQIAAHEEIIPIEELYEICSIARDLTKQEEYLVGRVIARPFIGEPGDFRRTTNRKDYALKPFAKTVLNYLAETNRDVISLGKINDIFVGEGITRSERTRNNEEGMDKLVRMIGEPFTGLCFLNLVDFDSLYGHRRDPQGYANALHDFDRRLPSMIESLRSTDLLLITADHGNDPTHPGTDHTREYVPLLAYHPKIEVGKQLPIRTTFADVGATIADNFNSKRPPYGTSFLDEL